MDPRKATVSLLYNGVGATKQISDYLSAFTYTDNASGAADTISITVNDPKKKWIGSYFPRHGDRLQPTIILQNWQKSGTKKYPCGYFTLDTFGFNGNPIKANIEAIALPAMTSFKTKKRTQTYEMATLATIGRIIAQRAGVALYFEGADIQIEKVEQNKEDDCEFYTKLVERYGLALKIYNKKLVVFSEAKYEGRGAKAVLTPADFEPGWSWDTKLEGTYTGVSYEYTNSDKNQTFYVSAGGSDERLLEVNEAAANLTEATAIALSALNNANKDKTTMSITMMARPGLIATDCVYIRGLGCLNGKYYIESIKHSIGSGYKMNLELRKVQARVYNANSYAATVEENARQESGDTASSSPAPAPQASAGMYTLTTTKTGYYTAAEARAGSAQPGHPTSVKPPGNYWIYKSAEGMLNLSNSQSTPGAWVNPG